MGTQQECTWQKVKMCRLAKVLSLGRTLTGGFMSTMYRSPASSLWFDAQGRTALQCVCPFKSHLCDYGRGSTALELACSEILHTSHSLEVANYLKTGIHPHWLSCRRAVDEGCVRGTSFIKAAPFPCWRHLPCPELTQRAAPSASVQQLPPVGFTHVLFSTTCPSWSALNSGLSTKSMQRLWYRIRMSTMSQWRGGDGEPTANLSQANFSGLVESKGIHYQEKHPQIQILNLFFIPK